MSYAAALGSHAIQTLIQNAACLLPSSLTIAAATENADRHVAIAPSSTKNLANQ